MADQFGMSWLLEKEAQRIEKAVAGLQSAVDGNRRAKLCKDLMEIAKDLRSMSDSAYPFDLDDNLDLAELRRHALPDGSIPAQVLRVRERKEGE